MPKLPTDQKGRDELHKRLGWRIEVIRRARGLTQTDLASAISLSKSFISLLETNRSQASLDTAVAIARRLKVSVAVLVGESRKADEAIAHIDKLLQLRRLLRQASKKVLVETGWGPLTWKEREQVKEKINQQVAKELEVVERAGRSLKA